MSDTEEKKPRRKRNPNLRIPIVALNKDCIPTYATDGSACADCKANITENVVIQPNSTALIPLGFKVNLKNGYEMILRPRSGLALKNSITLGNAVGTIDSDYIEEVGAIVRNEGTEPFTVEPLMRICQCKVSKVRRMQFEEIDTIVREDSHGDGFGSTGTA